MIPPRMAELMAKEEGYGIPGAIPTRDNNPGDLLHSPHSFHPADSPNSVGQINNPTDGWADLVRQLDIFAKNGLTLSQAIYTYAPPETNNSAAYLAYMVAGLGCTSDTLVSDALKVPGIGAYADEPA